MNGLFRRIVNNFSVGVLGRITGAMGPIFLLPLFARYWGAHLYGEWLIVSAIPTYIMIAPDLGIAPVVINKVARLAGNGQFEEAQGLYRASFLTLLPASFLFCSLGWILGYVIPWQHWLALTQLGKMGTSSILGFFCLQIFFQQMAFCVSAAYRTALQNARAALIGSVLGFLETGLSIFVLIIGASPIIYVMVLAFWKGLVLLVYILDSQRLPGAVTLGFNGANFRQILPLIKPGLGFAGLPLVYALQNQGMVAVVGVCLGPAAVAGFQAMRTMINGIRSIATIVGSAILVELPHAIGAGHIEIVARILQRYCQFGVGLTLSAIIGILLIGEWIFGVWTGHHLSYSPMLAFLLALSLVGYSFGAPLSLYANATNILHRVLVPNLLAIGATLILTKLTLPDFGLAGAGVAIFLWEAMQAIILFWLIEKEAVDVYNIYKRKLLSVNAFWSDLRLAGLSLRRKFAR